MLKYNIIDLIILDKILYEIGNNYNVIEMNNKAI
jgi:hypothetical protein